MRATRGGCKEKRTWGSIMIAGMIMRGASVAAVLAGLASPAVADWQYTKWGDTLQQVLVHTDKGVRPTTDAERDFRSSPSSGDALATSAHKVADMEIATFFFFKGVNLSRVQMEIPTPDAGDEVLANLEAQYGAPYFFSETIKPSADTVCSTRKAKWHSREYANNILYTIMYCGERIVYGRVIYTKILTPAESGL